MLVLPVLFMISYSIGFLVLDANVAHGVVSVMPYVVTTLNRLASWHSRYSNDIERT